MYCFQDNNDSLNGVRIGTTHRTSLIAMHCYHATVYATIYVYHECTVLCWVLVHVAWVSAPPFNAKHLVKGSYQYRYSLDDVKSTNVTC